MNQAKKLLIIGYVWPEPNSSAAGTRMVQLIQFFLQRNCSIVFASTAAPSEFAVDLPAMGVRVEEILLNDSGFDELLTGIQPDIVLFDRFMIEEQFSWRVAEICPSAIRILDTEDLHFLRDARFQAWKENRETSISDLQSDLAKREIASILRSDVSLIISEAEFDLLVQQFSIAPELLCYLPIWFESAQLNSMDIVPTFEEREDFVFIGNFWHEPNWQAVKFLKENIWPIIRKQLPHVSMQVYGAYPSQKVFELHQPKQGFLVHGRIRDASEAVRLARVCLAPLLFGAGIKGKLLEAMNQGTPSVTTPIGAEGIQESDLWPGFVETDAEAFALAACRLYSDALVWNQSRDKGFETLKSRFAGDSFAKMFEDRLNVLANHLLEHRQANFMGSILQHQTLRSTKYLSKWIELKNSISRDSN